MPKKTPQITYTREILIEAINHIRNNPDLRRGRNSIEYDLIYKDQKYPPILVLSEANKLNGGSELLLADFGNSTKKAFDILINLGFNVEKRDSYFTEQLKAFLQQAETSDLKVLSYEFKYSGLQIKVGFGMGTPARIPWLAFLGGNNTVSNGIYPVFLYYKKIKLLVLAYGISETTKPEYNWEIQNPTTINQYFLENNLGKPERYKNSYVYEAYTVDDNLNYDEIKSDVNVLISIYKGIIVDEKTQPATKHMKFEVEVFKDSLGKANLFFDDNLCLRFAASLITKPFTILTGLSGSGKTKLAQAFVQWICESSEQYKIIAVGADWTNSEPLLGFPNGLTSDQYSMPDSGALKILMEAGKVENQNKPYFLVLDEMNLSHVERYFADFLSVMESGKCISLYDGADRMSGKTAIPKDLCWPSNLFIIGTVNIDETTYMFSPKVLDRANVIEFRVSPDEMSSYLLWAKPLEMEKLFSDDNENNSGKGAKLAKDFLRLSRGKISSDKAKKALGDFFPVLQKAGAEFGYRTASEINRLVGVLETLRTDSNEEENDNLTDDDFIDFAIMQKLLPKLHGSRTRLVPVLILLGRLCITGVSSAENFSDKDDRQFIKENFDANLSVEKIKYKISFDKLRRMYRNVIANGFTSYAEA
jgi:5-methylcytosine-specific restriction enzyme B